MRPPVAQTALSDGFGPALHDFADVVDVASLDRASSRYLRRRAMDAVDHLIALLDALDAETEDREPDVDGGEADDADAEEDDPGEDDGTAEPSLGALERHPSTPSFSHHFRSEDGRQLAWAAGSTFDAEEEHDGREPDVDDEEDDPGEEDHRGHATFVGDYFRSGLALAV